MSFGNFVMKKDVGELNISHEVIEPQINDPIVKETCKYIDMVMDIYKENIGEDPKVLGKKTDKIYAELEEKLYDRFGINFKLLDLTNRELNLVGSPATIPIFMPALSKSANYKEMPIVKDIDKYKKELESIENMGPVKKFIFKRILNSYNLYMEEGLKVVCESGFDTVINLLSTDGIAVDLKHAKVLNLPKTVISPIILPIGQMVYGLTDLYGIGPESESGMRDGGLRRNITSREICAILFHEIGHSFTAIELAVQSYANNIVFEDVLQDQLRKNKKDISNAFIMAYEKAYKDNKIRKELIGKSDSEVIITVCSKRMDRYDYSGHENRNMGEAAADQFANRFGLGIDGAFALSSPFLLMSAKRDISRLFSVYIPSLLFNFINIGFIIGILLRFLMTGFALNPLIIVYIIFNTVYALIVGKLFRATTIYIFRRLNKTGGYPYDDDFTRVERIKSDIIRMLRAYKLSPQEQKICIEQVEKIENLIKNLKKNGVAENSFYLSNTPVLDFFSSTSEDISKYGKFDYVLEKMMENELYVDEAKLRLGD